MVKIPTSGRFPSIYIIQNKKKPIRNGFVASCPEMGNESQKRVSDVVSIWG
jgi:hypothetical protein